MNNAKCYKCGAAILFLTEQPADVNTGGYGKAARWIRTDPKPHPIDAGPSPSGNIAIYAYPGDVPGPGSELRNLDRPKTWFYRRMLNEALKFLKRCDDPPALYTSHFETCRERNKRN